MADPEESTLLPADWPAPARAAVERIARHYDVMIRGAWAVPDVEMDHAIELVHDELAGLDRAHEFDDESAWYRRYESGQLDPEIRAAILAWSTLIRQRGPRM